MHPRTFLQCLCLTIATGTMPLCAHAAESGGSGPVVQDPGAGVFLDHVREQCAGQKIGGRSIIEMLSGLHSDNQIRNFIDMTTELYAGSMSRDQYTTRIDHVFKKGDNQQALDCIFTRLDEAKPQ